ncbi:Uncharacterized protein At5g39865 [Linum perenne]
MWPEWLSSPTRLPPLPPSSSSPAYKKKFSCSSFKDIQALISEPDDHAGSQSLSPRSPSVFHRVWISSSVLRYLRKSLPPPLPSPPECVVLYFTSLRVVRRTYEDCRAVRSILRGIRAPVDERDLSMDGNYLEELQNILGTTGKVTLPVVLIGGKCIAGVEGIRELHENGELKKMIEGLPPASASSECDLCGGLRFLLCEECSGSHKIYTEKQGFKSCNACNVNGLIHCPDCHPASRRRMSIA